MSSAADTLVGHPHQAHVAAARFHAFDICYGALESNAGLCLCGDPIVVVLTETVSDAHLAGLRGEGVSYFFAGKSELDLALILDILNRELGVKRLLLEGGGGSNGAFLRAGLVDELNLILCPAVDGAKGAPSVFDSPETETDERAPVTAMELESSRVLEGGAMLLRYRIQNADAAAAAGR
jgi:riboflavin biosynthesis pyrimidine reductase